MNADREAADTDPALDQPCRVLVRRLLAGGGGLALLGVGKGLFRAAEFAAQVGDQRPEPGEVWRQDGHAQPPYCA
ncbi:hypothetical protein ACFWC9_39975 [Streptomyces goshikiensis]|uniref:hypothetical protein n=1 Tax=Streptomyces goshikiensis TaxID=1942 RepID=UPI0036B592E9